VSDTKFTPGPWRWEITNGILNLCGGNPKYDVSVMDFVRDGMQGATARFRENVPMMNIMHKAQEHSVPAPGREHHKWFRLVDHHDAHLIAAAPDLYEALDDLAIWWENWMPDNADGGHDALFKARAALAKARGEAQS
jgi:hypothetical protein